MNRQNGDCIQCLILFHLYGFYIGTFCMEVAIRKARENGVGWVTAKGSNHFGICQWYTAMAAKESLIGMASTNTSPLVAPTRSQKEVFGTNPIAVSYF